MTTELAIRPDQTSFDEKQIAALRSLGVEDAPPADVALLFHHATRTGLDPMARQIYLIGRWDRKLNRKKWAVQTGIDGFRLIRDRKGTFRGQDEEWCGEDGVWHDVWLKKTPPAAAKVSVYVEGMLRPMVGIARWVEYAPENGPMWSKMPGLMLAKCAEALALRKAFPQDLSGLYIAEEMEADRGEVIQVQPSEPPKQAPRTAVEQRKVNPDTYVDMAMHATTVDALRQVYRDAKKAAALDADTSHGMTVSEAIDARREALEQQETGQEPPELAIDGEAI